ncbi:elongation of very long chain fatty acids protein 6-like protein, partial [Leptotrombidium deliense]
MNERINDTQLYKIVSVYGIDINFDANFWFNWQNDYWYISIWFSAIYIFSCFAGQKWMQNRNAFNLRFMLSLWSCALAVFSVMGAFTMVPELLFVLRNNGFHSSVCDSSFMKSAQQLFWQWLFAWSKLIEFGDTVFIILRKQKLSFLHLYHHALTLIWCFIFFPTAVGVNRWKAVMNYFVHSFMYSYYSAKAAKINFPKIIPMFITTIQIIQMFVGMLISTYTMALNFGDFASECNISKG